MGPLLYYASYVVIMFVVVFAIVIGVGFGVNAMTGLWTFLGLGIAFLCIVVWVYLRAKNMVENPYYVPSKNVHKLGDILTYNV